MLFGFALGKIGLLDPDEPFYSLTAKEMLVRHDPSTPVLFGRPQFEKPILFYWVLYSSFRWLGVSEFSARLGPVLAGILTVLVTYLWALALFKRRRAAFLSAFFLAASGQFMVMSRIVLTDIFLCLFVTCAFCCFTLGHQNEKNRAFYWNLMFFFFALGFLTKGPLGLLIPLSGILSYFYFSGEHRFFKQIPWMSGGILFAIVALPWYVLMTYEHAGFLKHFFLHENVRRFFVAEHRGSDKLLFYPIVLFIGFFPWSIFISSALFYAARKTLSGQKRFLFLFGSFSICLVFFILAKSKLISYFFPLYPVLALMTGAWMDRFLRSAGPRARAGFFLKAGTALLWVLAPPALLVATFIYARKNEVDLLRPLIYCAVTSMLFSWIAAGLFFARYYRAALAWMGISMVFFSALSFSSVLPAVEDIFSSKKSAQDYREFVRGSPSALILASKLFVRGISYYTGDPNVGVFSDRPSGGFYTPHPIRVISDKNQLAAILPGEFPVYLLIREKEVKKLREITGSEYSVSVLENNPSRCWVRLERV